MVAQATLSVVAEPVGNLPNITVSIGRNIGERPMTATAWARFQLQTFELVVERADVLSQTVGTSLWIDDGETVCEDSYSIIGRPHGVTSVRVIRSGLARLAKIYRQDAIALTTATADFVGAF